MWIVCAWARVLVNFGFRWSHGLLVLAGVVALCQRVGHFCGYGGWAHGWSRCAGKVVVFVAEVIPRAVVEADAVGAGLSRARRERFLRLASQSAGADTGLRRSGHGWRRTERDEQLLQFVTLHGMILLRQAAKWFYSGKDETALKRVTKMEQAGLVNRDSGVADWAGTVITPTTAGQRVGVLELPTVFDNLVKRQLSVPDNLLHAALVADRILVTQAKGYRVLTERQIRLLDKADPDEVRAYLATQGVKFASEDTDPGVRPGVVFRERPTGDGDVKIEQYETYLAAPVPSPSQPSTTRTPQSVRFPDFVYVTRLGELVAMEVEIATKASDRLQGIVAGYSRTVARMIPDGMGSYRRATTAEGQVSARPLLERHQFRQVQWWCVPESANLLRGRWDVKRNQWGVGFIPRMMPFEYQAPDRPVDWHSQQSSLPMTVHEVTADDSGVQYALDQRVLPPHYRCSYKRWKVWRQVWRQHVPLEYRERAVFTRWLMVPGRADGEVSNLALCTLTEQDLLNAAPLRRS